MRHPTLPGSERETRLHSSRARPLWGLLIALLAGPALALHAGARIKDIATFAGARGNQLLGYGLVTGIAGDGDKNPVYTLQTLANLLQRNGLKVPALTISSKNVAAVMITAEIPAFVKPGSRIDIIVSSLGDAKTLQGGVLLQTPLLGADGKVYAVAQGALYVGGFAAGNEGPGGASVQKNNPTTAQIVGGAIVEQEIPMELVQDRQMELLLREPDFTTAARLAVVVNQLFPDSAQALDSTSIRLRLPEGAETSPVDFIARLEALEVNVDTPARIIINERTGTIVATSFIRIAACAVSHGNLTITIASTLNTSQPNAFANRGRTTVTPSTDTRAQEQNGKLVPLPEMPTVEQVASSLNALGLTPRDMMAIFQAMKQAGALQADLILR